MQRIPSVYVTSSAIHGRGVFTSGDIEEGTLIEICPVIVIPEIELNAIHATILHDYYYYWGEEEKEAAIVLGFGSIYNHSFKPNAEVVPSYEDFQFSFYAKRKILAGEEITVNYNGDDDNSKEPLWFHDKGSERKQT